MRRRPLPHILEAPSRQPLSTPLANRCLLAILIALAKKIETDRGVLEPDLLPLVTIFGNAYALSGTPAHGYLYAVKRGKAGGVPALMLDGDLLWKYPPALNPTPLGSFLESVTFETEACSSQKEER